MNELTDVLRLLDALGQPCERRTADVVAMHYAGRNAQYRVLLRLREAGLSLTAPAFAVVPVARGPAALALANALNISPLALHGPFFVTAADALAFEVSVLAPGGVTRAQLEHALA